MSDAILSESEVSEAYRQYCNDGPVKRIIASHELLRAKLADAERDVRILEKSNDAKLDMWRQAESEVTTLRARVAELESKLAEAEATTNRCIAAVRAFSYEWDHGYQWAETLEEIRTLRARIAVLEGAARYAVDALRDIIEGDALPVTPEIAMNRLDAALDPADAPCAAPASGKEPSDGE